MLIVSSAPWTLILIVSGGRKSPDIVSWLKKKTGDPCTVVTTKDEVDAEVANSHFAVLGAFKVRHVYLYFSLFFYFPWIDFRGSAGEMGVGTVTNGIAL